MDGDDKTSRERKQRMRARRDAEGMAQVSGWVPSARRAYAREVLRAVAGGANSLPPDPELAAALDTLRDDLTKARAELEVANARERALQADLDAARASEAEGQVKVQATTLEVREATKAAQAAMQRAEAAETAIGQAKGLPGIKGRLVRWLAGDVLN